MQISIQIFLVKMTLLQGVTKLSKILLLGDTVPQYMTFRVTMKGKSKNHAWEIYFFQKVSYLEKAYIIVCCIPPVLHWLQLFICPIWMQGDRVILSSTFSRKMRWPFKQVVLSHWQQGTCVQLRVQIIRGVTNTWESAYQWQICSKVGKV